MKVQSLLYGHGGNQEKVAEELGETRGALRAFLARNGIAVKKVGRRSATARSG